MILEILTFLVALVAFCFSIVAYMSGKRREIIELSSIILEKIYNSPEIYEMLYLYHRQEFSFCFADRGTEIEKNFVGSSIEKDIDNFLESINFACFWLLEEKTGRAELLFSKEIHRVLNSVFFRHYLSFLKRNHIDTPEGVYFPFLYIYANNRLNLQFDGRDFPETAADCKIG